MIVGIYSHYDLEQLVKLVNSKLLEFGPCEMKFSTTYKDRAGDIVYSVMLYQ